MRAVFRAVMTAALVTLAAGQAVRAEWNANAEQEARATVAAFQRTNPKIQAFFDQARGYVVFPTVGKGGFGIGGAYGSGTVFERGRAIGSSKLVQVTFGLQLGGQAYSEIVFFQNAAAMDKFKKGGLELGAQASAVALSKGAAFETVFNDGIAVFTLVKGGLMYEASVGGQTFTFDPR